MNWATKSNENVQFQIGFTDSSNTWLMSVAHAKIISRV